ncbi:MAG: hypothetical protein KC620_07950, partial [Myxococcales bacterium]|nr:hypothetical protein [Myxococcales bacterium]
MSPAALEGLEQTRLLHPADRLEQMTRAFWRSQPPDYAAADTFFINRRRDPNLVAQELSDLRQLARQRVDASAKNIQNILDSTSRAGRPSAAIGDGTSEAALFDEIATGRPVGGHGHAEKVDTSIRGLDKGRRLIRDNLNVVGDPDLTR